MTELCRFVPNPDEVGCYPLPMHQYSLIRSDDGLAGLFIQNPRIPGASTRQAGRMEAESMHGISRSLTGYRQEDRNEVGKQGGV